jgi:hypothetical protein
MATNPDPRYTYAAATVATDTAEGVSVVLKRGAVWAADDSFVLARPDLFCADVTEVGPDWPRRTVAVADLPPEPPKTTRRGLRRR